MPEERFSLTALTQSLRSLLTCAFPPASNPVEELLPFSSIMENSEFILLWFCLQPTANAELRRSSLSPLIKGAVMRTGEQQVSNQLTAADGRATDQITAIRL